MSAEINENDIAIIGMAIRVPGANTPAEFWKNLRDGVCSTVNYTDAELLAAGESPELLADPNYVRSGTPLQGLENFDGDFFGFSQKECAVIDPQHRHFYEAAWEAFENAGYPPEKLDGSTGVYAGCGMGSYLYFNLVSHADMLRDPGLFLLRHTGNDKDFLATRVSYLLDLKGPSVSVQTACSTSLVAVHQAAQALLSRECDFAVAGGVTIEIPHRRGYVYKEGEVLSPTGRCHAFDHRAQGTVFGSGVGVVLLRRLSDAIAAGDHVHAVIKATAINNDGASKVGYLAPSVSGQADCMMQAHALADVSAETITYVETHGTGTYMGDPIEIAALTEAFRRSTDKKGFCRIGSVKTNIGHLDTAAGVVSLIKATLALEAKQLPPSLNFEKPNPTIDFANSPFVVNTELTPWTPPEGVPRRAAVNSLGVGGTNAHVILEEAPKRAASGPAGKKHQLLGFSAKQRKSLDEYGKKLASHLRENGAQPLADVAWTLHHGRRAMERRRVLVASSHAEASERLEANDPQRIFTHTALENPTVAFLFPGGAAQYAGMARGLYASEPAFREVVDRGLKHLKGKLDEDLGALLLTEPDLQKANAALEKSTLQLPAIHLVNVAVARLLMSKGIAPQAMIGHSLGEYAAAHLADVMSLEDSLDIVTLRGQLLTEVGKGGMISVPLSEDELRPMLPASLDLAAVNAPGLCSVSGSRDELEAFEAQLKEKGIEIRWAPIDVAPHSRHLDAILPRFRAAFEKVKLKAPSRPYVSCFTGTWITPAQAQSPQYWAEHFRNTVRFADGVGTLAEEKNRIFIEVGPGKTLGSLAKQHAQVDSQAVLSTLRHRDEAVADEAFFLEVLGRVWALGLKLDVDALLWKGEKRQRVELPTYAFAHQKYWVERREGQTVQSEVLLRRHGDLEDFGYAPTWKQVGVDGEATDEKHRWLVFLDDTGVGESLVERLRGHGHAITVVKPGDTYAKVNDGEYLLAPERGREGYDALVRDLVKSAFVPTRILHTWLLTQDESFRPGSSFFHRNQERGFYSLFFLAQALADENVPRPLDLFVLGNGMQRLGDEALPYPEKATVLGPVKVIPRELPGVTCTAIDLQLPTPSQKLFGGSLRKALIDPFAGRRNVSDQYATLVDALEEELRSPARNAVAAYRKGKRFEAHFGKVKLSGSSASGAGSVTSGKLRERGVYLVTGGLGGIGHVIAEQLARQVKAKLVLTGRSPLPPRSEWSDYLAAVPSTDSAAKRIRQVQALEALGAEVMVAEADVTNLEDMTAVVRDAKARFGTIHGVVHAAGYVSDGPIQAKTMSQIAEVFAPKVYGTEILDGLFPPGSLELFVLFSSTSTLLAAAGQVDYVAANDFLNAFAHSRTARGDRGTVALQWGIWNEVGMAAAAWGKASGHELVFEPVSLPFFEAVAHEQDGTAVVKGKLHPKTHWVLGDHRTGEGHALIPGTGYFEFASEALRAIGETQPFEVSDLFFIRPFYVGDGEPTREMRVKLKRTEQGYAMQVRSECLMDGRKGWQLHAQAAISLLDQPKPGALDVEKVRTRCDVKRLHDEKGLRSPQEKNLQFGARWRVLRELNLGKGEALGRVALQPQHVADLESGIRLHPAQLDFATGFAIELAPGYTQDSLWVPVSYDQVRVHGALPAEIWSHVRAQPAGDGFVRFDADLADADGRILMEVRGFAMKRLGAGVAFNMNAPPAPSEVELESTKGGDAARTPAEERLRRQVSQGIRPSEGAEAFLRAVAKGRPQLMVSSLDLEGLKAELDRAPAVDASSSGAKFARPELDSAYVQPRNDIERTLAGFWEELLGVEQVGVEDSFFDLGGHSLIAVRLFAMIKKAYAVDFPISVLFEAPTIARCAAKIAETRGDAPAAGAEGSTPAVPQTRYTHLVAMHPGEGGKKSPFFLVAGMFGNVLNLRHLAHLLGTDRPFYGLQARGLYGQQEPHETFEEMAEAYLAELRTVQPHGPYYLGGFSGGGYTAYEMAHRLRAMGEEVAVVVMLDTPASLIPAPLSLEDRVRVQVQKFERGGPKYVLDWAKSRAEWELSKVRRRFEEPVHQAPTTLHNDVIEAAFRRALSRYTIRPYSGRVVLFRPKLNPTYVLAGGRMLNKDREYMYADNGWGKHVPHVEVFEVPGDHDSMVLEPNVRALATRMRRILEDEEKKAKAAAQKSSAA